MRRRLLATLALLALLGAVPAAAGEERPSLAELEGELICPTCRTTLAESNAPIAQRMRVIIEQRIRAGDTKSEIKDRMVQNFGPGVLAAPSREGFDLLAWLVPLAGLGLGAVAVGLLAHRWSRGRQHDEEEPAPDRNGRTPLDPELERQLDRELRLE